MSDAIIQADGVNRVFTVGGNRLHVLKDVALRVATGEAVAVVGASGAGKSTLLYTIGGLDRPTSGRVLFKGADLYALPGGARTRIRARDIGFVFQSYYLMPELDVAENVMLPAMTGEGPFKGSRAARKARAAELLAAVGLAERAGHTPAELSGGEQQRVALARALINEPEIVMADEPTGNLDSRTGGQVLDYLFSLTKDQGRTLVLVTHNPALAERCDRVVELADGRLANG
ncbi:MAG: ABC transporter ATP-binding protein [Kiritimatiellae bacterium]|nr:ABC transporter ATP-binding protein [Kiritimatiellia bacterium]